VNAPPTPLRALQRSSSGSVPDSRSLELLRVTPRSISSAGTTSQMALPRKENRERRHRDAADIHTAAAGRHDQAARFWIERGDERRTGLERRAAELERALAQLEREYADVEQL
jgi:hypothetical protein